ncbi:hypothetical protein METBIDRAFT_31664 [Metschnikowia bicuspidata var. bicuspidata NRRL YB-4993]|uniref:Glucosidase II subunit alpha n=1 Tax=Metschnikowia bicuspidata var. bicuspidata NRRL YB-4993 TaxID=869754 RepID=A0A1A0HA88_9ASCO|nr:hypothetical protein METBIDRAFT_31664 [Metschnikowia bicuspidata var. bicuspidata NRRL YB-4993]OBA21044.1 hypothetical protein METBIDRAFT_31664 [Metschnikowia bicuspidata var. bicuspidata NRRL YB-4993]
MQRLAPIWAVLLMLATAGAVKEYLFKDCRQSGFCHRNRHYASQMARLGASALPYTIAPGSVSVSDTHIHGLLTKSLPHGGHVQLPWLVSVLNGDSVRFKVDENRSHVDVEGLDCRRYDQALDAVFGAPAAAKTTPLEGAALRREAGRVTYAFGPAGSYSVAVQYSPVKVTICKAGEPQVVINDRALLNMEHFRAEADNAAHVHAQLELDFDMFRDSFGDAKNDRLPLGPEAVAVDVRLPGYRHVYGVPEHADALSLKDTTHSDWPYRLFNVDIFEYETDSRMPMYGAIPLLVGAKPGAAVGVLWASAADTFVDVHKAESVAAHWISENGVLDMVVILGDRPADVNRKYGLLAGFAALPQEFALGYHQCRWNYNDVADVLAIADQMDQHLVPFDTVWLDIEYADRKQYFTWNPSTFGGHAAMMELLDVTGRNLVVIVDPHLKTGYGVSDRVELLGIGIKTPANATYKGHCWPGESVWVDALNPLAQAYWDLLFAFHHGLFLGRHTNVHLWNDMNEPSFFNGPETSSPRDNLHYGAVEHRSVHNLWGKAFHELTHNALSKRLAPTSRQRPFILTRSYYAGSQRTAAMWTGDNMASWEHLRASVPMVLTSNVVNMPFAGADVGGFFGDPSKELLARWYQTGIWYPFFRAHAHIDSRRREPWVPGEPYLSIIRDAVRLRYALLPTLYTLFHEASVDGTPVWRPMFYESPEDTLTYELDDQFFLGNSGLLVKPATEEACDNVSVYIPHGQVYYDYTNGRPRPHSRLEGSGRVSKKVSLADIPVFVKGGSILARRDRYRRSAKLMRNDPYSLVVALSKDSTAQGRLYIDDGESYGYKEGKSLLVSFEATAGRLTGTSRSGDETYAASLRHVMVERITIVGWGGSHVEGVEITQQDTTWSAKFERNGDMIEVLGPKLNIVDDWVVRFREVEQDVHDEL